MLRDWEHSFILPVYCFDVVDIYIYELNHFSCFVQLIVVAQQTVFLAGSGALHACVWESFTVSLFTIYHNKELKPLCTGFYLTAQTASFTWES